MALKPDAASLNASFDKANLFREESFTDRKTGTIRKLTPVTADGVPDSSRPILYVGQTQVLTSMGTLPLAFEIEAKSLDEALANFGKGAKEAFERTLRELEEMRRQAASSIVIPERGAGAVPPGGGKLQLP
jgi:hypothetical protein